MEYRYHCLRFEQGWINAGFENSTLTTGPLRCEVTENSRLLCNLFSKEGIKSSEQKIETIRNLENPKCKRNFAIINIYYLFQACTSNQTYGFLRLVSGIQMADKIPDTIEGTRQL